MGIGEGWWILAGFVGATLFLAAYLTGRGAEPTPPTVTVGSSSPDPDCEMACADLELRRQERCRAKFAETAAKAELDGRDKDFFAAATALGVATAAAFGAIALPWPANLIAGMILWTIVTVLLAVMMYFLGKRVIASDAWAAASKVLTDANNAVLDARNVVLAKCPAERATTCLNLPDPC